MTIEASFVHLDSTQDGGEKWGVRLHGMSAEIRGMTGQTVEVRRKDRQHVARFSSAVSSARGTANPPSTAWTRPERHPRCTARSTDNLPTQETDEPEWEAAYGQEAYDRQHPDEPLFEREPGD